MGEGQLRIGILGAAQIAPMALVRPARAVPEVEVRAVAARAPERARAFADRHRIPVVHARYEDLIADLSLDAVYNPLPNSHHCEWTVRALEAGKHVLCEKPLASNADEARQMEAAAARTGRVLMEAFHWRYHPLAERMRALIAAGEVGAVRHIEARFCVPLVRPGDIRFRLDLAGGATMDTGCYTVHIVRTLAGAEPEVVRAEARLASPGVDRWMAADLRFPDGRTGRIECSLFSRTLLAASARVAGDAGTLRALNPIAPQLWHRLELRGRGGRRVERLRSEGSYTHQLRAFRDAVLHGKPFPTHPADAVANMRVIDAIYEAAGLGRRGGAATMSPA